MNVVSSTYQMVNAFLIFSSCVHLIERFRPCQQRALAWLGKHLPSDQQGADAAVDHPRWLGGQQSRALRQWIPPGDNLIKLFSSSLTSKSECLTSECFQPSLITVCKTTNLPSDCSVWKCSNYFNTQERCCKDQWNRLEPGSLRFENVEDSIKY